MSFIKNSIFGTFRDPCVPRAGVGEVTGMGRVVAVDMVMKAGGTHLRLKEAAVAGLDRWLTVIYQK